MAMADKSGKSISHDFVIKEIHDRIRTSTNQIRQRMRTIQQDLIDDEHEHEHDSKDNL